MSILCDGNNENEDLACITKADSIKESTITINEDDLNDNEIENFKIDNTLYIEVITNNNIPVNYKVKISSYTNKVITFTPSIPTGFTMSNIFIIPNQISHMIKLKEIGANKNFYQLSNFNDNILNGFGNNYGGKLQCKYVQRDNSDKVSSSSLGFVDVKGYKKDDFIDYGYFQFDKTMEEDENSKIYNIKDVECSEILSTRKDMTLLNPITIKDNDNYDRITHELKWSNYVEVLGSYLDKILISSVVSFGCYKSTQQVKKITIYEDITLYTSFNDIIFVFNKDNEPSVDDTCYLLSDENGAIDIESSDLSELIRKDEKGDYYYGKYVDVNDKTNEIIANEDGSQTVVLGKDSFVAEEADDKTKTKDKIIIGKLSDTESPSMAYPPVLISDGIRKSMVVGTTIEFTIDGAKQYAQILKVKVNKVNKFELYFDKPVSIGRRLRSLSNSRLLADFIVMNWKSEASVHAAIECSGQGSCDRTSGICSCYDGFTGDACQRLDCPNNCNGNGRCVPLSELLSNNELSSEYDGFGNKHKSEYTDTDGNNKEYEFEDQVFGCLCDKRHRGYDCSLIECPSGKDPEEATNIAGKEEMRDCSGRGICNYNTGICECFDGFSGEGCQTMSQMM